MWRVVTLQVVRYIGTKGEMCVVVITCYTWKSSSSSVTATRRRAV